VLKVGTPTKFFDLLQELAHAPLLQFYGGLCFIRSFSARFPHFLIIPIN
jgi:hypothetical protein